MGGNGLGLPVLAARLGQARLAPARVSRSRIVDRWWPLARHRPL